MYGKEIGELCGKDNNMQRLRKGRRKTQRSQKEKEPRVHFEIRRVWPLIFLVEKMRNRIILLDRKKREKREKRTNEKGATGISLGFSYGVRRP